LQDLGQIKSYYLDNKIILAIDSRWIEFFNSKNPTFNAIIENGKYVLVGPKVNRTGPTSDHTSNEADRL